ncbi:hypothetical protein Ancab_034396, partial [Ancistrocladus abbreviatus]
HWNPKALKSQRQQQIHEEYKGLAAALKEGNLEIWAEQQGEDLAAIERNRHGREGRDSCQLKRKRKEIADREMENGSR